ncbi:hypothetical protein [Longispora albida]|uniref:hypothetical protein n=1 Tax=Longispora albida TaxID=203523 RepID=UPI000382D92F|nr:hypothetical protein [Longispora albida]
MDPVTAARLLTEHAAARDALLARLVSWAAAEGHTLWQAGSFSRGAADEWSDLDLVLTGAQPPATGAALRVINPANGLDGYGYVGEAHLTGPLLHWIDWYPWPADLPAPADALLLTGTGEPGELDLVQSLDTYTRGTGTERPDADTFALAMIPIAAKYVARGDTDDAAGMVEMLGGDPEADPVTELRALVPAGAPADIAERVHLTLDVAGALRPQKERS